MFECYSLMNVWVLLSNECLSEITFHLCVRTVFFQVCYFVTKQSNFHLKAISRLVSVILSDLSTTTEWAHSLYYVIFIFCLLLLNMVFPSICSSCAALTTCTCVSVVLVFTNFQYLSSLWQPAFVKGRPPAPRAPGRLASPTEDPFSNPLFQDRSYSPNYPLDAGN